MFKKIAATAALVAIGSSAALAGTATVTTTSGTLQVNAVVNASCSAAQVAAVDFGTKTSNSIISATETTPGSISVTCTDAATEFAVALPPSFNGNAGQRRMQAGFSGNYLPYDLFVDAGRTVPFATAITTGAGGSTLGDPNSPTGTPGGVIPTANGSVTIPVYAKVPGTAAKPVAGTYSDTLQIVIGY
jgi:spore coat protein U-like protein